MNEMNSGSLSNTPKQRKNPRARFNTTVNMVFVDGKTFSAMDGSEKFRVHRAEIKNISSVGMLLRTCDFDPNFEPRMLAGEIALSFKFSLPGYINPINVLAKVMRVTREASQLASFYNIGIQFIKINPVEQAAIDRYLKGNGKKDI